MKKGSALVGALILMVGMLVIGLSLSSAVLSTYLKTTRAYKNISALSYAEAGIHKALYELNKPSSTYTGELDNISLGGGSFDVTVVNTGLPNVKYITATGYVPSKAKPQAKKQVRVKIGDKPSATGVAFNYGVQVGPLGVIMSNNSAIIGNVYGQGTFQGSINALVTGDLIMSGATGRITETKVNGNAKAHTIDKSRIEKDAYFQTISNTTVGGTQYPNSPDPIDYDLPIALSTITDWESAAAAVQVHEGNLILSESTSTLGPIKINGNLTITNNSIITLTGTVWVTGNVEFANNAIVNLDPGYGSSSGMIIADSQTDDFNYGKVLIQNNVIMGGSGTTGSYLMILSANSGSTTANPAIDIANNSSAVVYYSTVGLIEVKNNARIRAISGGGLYLSNGAIIEYDTGLANGEFTGGPGGAWSILEWQIIY